MENRQLHQVSSNFCAPSSKCRCTVSTPKPFKTTIFVIRMLIGGGKLFVLLAIGLSCAFKSAAQLPCLGVTNQCAGFDPIVWDSYKCITGPVTFSELISSNPQLLLPQSTAVNTLQRLVVKGIIKDDISTASGGYTFAEGSEIIFADEQSGIEVETQCQLVLNKTTLRGCSSMWKSVYVKPVATFIAKNDCNFYDGIEAIIVEHNAIISITDCNFSNNLFAIRLGSVLPNNQRMPIYFTPNGGIWGNKITGGSLQLPYIGAKSFEGISIRNVTNIQIGKTELNTNEFSAFKNSFMGDALPCAGIYNNNSEITVVNSRFWDIGFPSTPPINVPPRLQDAAISGANKGKTTFVGFGLSIDAFEGCNGGIYLNYSSGDISNTKFHNNEHDIVHESTLAKALGNLKVNNCTFEGFNQKGVWLKAGNKIPLSIFEIKNCTFDDNRTISDNRVYLSVEPGAQTDATNFNIADNKFYFRNRPGLNFYSASCVTLNNLNKGVAVRNDFYDEGMVLPHRTFIGASVNACIDFRWDSNNFIGSGSAIGLGDDVELGLNVSNAPFCKYLCNHFTSLQIGLKFNENCDATIITNNQFNGNLDHGIDLGQELPPIFSVIGRQDRRSNTWTGAGANMDYANYNPNDLNDVLSVQRSLFSIQTINETSSLWANPRQVGGMDDAPFHNWFKFKPYQVGDPQPNNPCAPENYSTPSQDLDYWDLAVINNTFLPWKGFGADTWETSFYLYKRMTEDPSLIPVGSAAANWYAGQYNGNLGKLSRAFNGLVTLSENLPASVGTQLLSDLNAITVTTTHEQNLKTTLRILLEQYLFEQETCSPQQVSGLSAIAGQCRFEGGIGVVLARMVLGQPSVQPGDCSSSIERSAKIGAELQRSFQSIGAIIYPNPTNCEINVQLNQPVLGGLIRLFDSKSQVVGTWTISGTEMVIRPAMVTPGIYWLEIADQGMFVSRSKVVFIR